MKKININFVILFVGGLLLGFVLSYCTVSFIDSYNYLSNSTEKSKENKKDEGYVIYFDDKKEKNDINSDADDYNYGIVQEDGLEIKDNYVEEESSYDSSSNVTPVTYFENVENSNDENVIKNGFVKIVDFIFYDEEINGYTFDELTAEAKLKIMKIALSIDNKIDEYFPGYKETIGNGTKKIYNNIKGFVVELYLDTTTMICESNESVCQHAKEDFAFMKKSFGITWDLIKSFAEAGTDKLKAWYEIFRG